MIDEKRIYLIGAGNIGINMGIALKRVGFSFSGVFSRSEDKGFMVSKKLRCKYVNNLYDIPDNTNIIIFALPDNVLIEVAGKFKASKQIVIHTAGSVDISILLKTSKNIGVFYPLQTFSANRKISFKDVPVFIEASNKKTLAVLNNIAHSLKALPYFVNSETRKILHVAAVFASNYTNFIIYNAEKILKENNLNPEWLHPLIKETFIKSVKLGAKYAQTGPAIRGDDLILQQHLNILKNNKSAQEIYKLLSVLIKKEFNK